MKFWATLLHQYDFKVTFTPFLRTFASKRSPTRSLVYYYHTAELEIHDKMEKEGLYISSFNKAKLKLSKLLSSNYNALIFFKCQACTFISLHCFPLNVRHAYIFTFEIMFQCSFYFFRYNFNAHIFMRFYMDFLVRNCILYP